MVAADLTASSGAVQQQQQQEAQLLEKNVEIDNVRSPLALSEKSNVAGLRKPRNREITSRYKTATTASSAAASNGLAPAAAAAPRRHPSPTLGRNSPAAEVPVLKRASSAERRRPWPATTSSSAEPRLSLSTSADGLWSSKRPVPRASAAASVSGAGLLWPSSHSQAASFQQGDAAAHVSNSNASFSRREAREGTLSRPQTPAKDATRPQTLAREGRPQTPVRDGRPQTPVKEGRPQTPPAKETSRPQTPPAKEARPQTPPAKEVRPQTPPAKEVRPQTPPAKEARPQTTTPVKELRAQTSTAIKDARPQTPVKDARPQTPVKDGRPQTPVKDGRPQTPVRRDKDASSARRESPKRETPRRDSPKREGGMASENALRPTANGVPRTAEPTSAPPSRKGSPVRRQNTDQVENARPLDNSPSKPDLQRWPGTSNGKSFGSVMSRSMDLGSERDRPLGRAATMLVQSQNGSATTSRPVKTAVSKSFSRSINEGPAAVAASQGVVRRVSLESRGRGSGSTSESNGKLIGSQEGAQNAQAAEGSIGPEASLSRVRQVQQEAELAGSDANVSANFEIGSDSDSVSSSGSGGGSRGPGRGTVVAARFWPTTSARAGRQSGEGFRSSAPDSDVSAGAIPGGKGSSRSSKALTVAGQSGNNMAANGITSAWAMSPSRVPPLSVSVPVQTPVSPSKPASPSRGLPSPTRQRMPSAALPPSGSSSSRISNALGMLNFGVDSRRGKKSMTQQEEVQLLRVLHNRWLQWRFVNARAEAAMSSQRATAERSLYSVWSKTTDLRESVALKRIQVQQARQAQKLDSILLSQKDQLENWVELEPEHTAALAGATEALESAILRVPVTGGARADLQAVREALGSAYEVMNAMEYSVNSLLPKAAKMGTLLAQLADTAVKERALLAECGDLLDVASALEIEERSLRTHLMQIDSEKSRMSKTSINGGLAASDSVMLSSP